MAHYYANEVNRKPYNALYERPGTISLLPDLNGLRVLDAGCGAGFMSKWVVDHGAHSVIGVDFSENMLAFANSNIDQRCQYHLHDLNQPMDFIQNEVVDLVVSSLTLHYLNDLDMIFSEFFRVLQRNGRVVFSIHHPSMILDMHQLENYFQTQYLKDWWNTPNGPVEVTHIHRPLRDYSEAIYKNGFLIEMIEEPMPLSSMQNIDPQAFQLLSTKPRFLFFRLVKQEP
ncbi:MAG: class I SAM-dependent methyltransferase [Anaerolineae bacterium]|nr:class I SAM-dependent methyltransferase [Anaerolineae bacterium]